MTINAYTNGFQKFLTSVISFSRRLPPPKQLQLDESNHSITFFESLISSQIAGHLRFQSMYDGYIESCDPRTCTYFSPSISHRFFESVALSLALVGGLMKLLRIVLSALFSNMMARWAQKAGTETISSSQVDVLNPLEVEMKMIPQPVQ